MKLLAFKTSPPLTLGVELEIQIINPATFSLVSRAKELMRSIKQSDINPRIKPEITQSMVEINTRAHHNIKDLHQELLDLQHFLIAKAQQLDVLFCGGGTHPFQKWTMQKIFPTIRYKKLSRIYRFLSKRSTIFGQHVHIGCEDPEDAIYLTHALSRYIPQFIALCASSPFYQGVDTGYYSSRSTIFMGYQSSGVMPLVMNWAEFSEYYHKMRYYRIIDSMKDFYWDVRPKPEFGTVEIRVFDTPLTLKKAVMMAAYVQALSAYLLAERPFKISKALYDVYYYNRFQAGRYGFNGDFIDFTQEKHLTIKEDILDTLKKIERTANQLNTMVYLTPLIEELIKEHNDAVRLRQIAKQVGSLPKLVAEQCKIWQSD
jgi:glutamate---cysteine ligase / carboxylate-amine ligase